METDLELLEMAAKAAEIQIDRWHSNGGDYWTGRDIDDKDRNPGLWTRWNPLTDDGDALRLAVKLGLRITHYPIYDEPKRAVIVHRPRWDSDRLSHTTDAEALERYADDPLAASRLAIVRAAAEIGKAMP